MDFPMKIIQRSYSTEQDKYLISALARQFSENNLHVIDLPYRLSSWAFDNPENISLWFADSGHVAQSFRGMPHTHSGACRTVRRGETLVEFIVP